MVQVSTGLDCTPIALSYPSGFLDVVFHLLLRTTIHRRVVNTRCRNDGPNAG